MVQTICVLLIAFCIITIHESRQIKKQINLFKDAIWQSTISELSKGKCSLPISCGFDEVKLHIVREYMTKFLPLDVTEIQHHNTLYNRIIEIELSGIVDNHFGETVLIIYKEIGEIEKIKNR